MTDGAPETGGKNTPAGSTARENLKNFYSKTVNQNVNWKNDPLSEIRHLELEGKVYQLVPPLHEVLVSDCCGICDWLVDDIKPEVGLLSGWLIGR